MNMQKFLFLLGVLCVCVCSLYSQSQFIYLRYDPIKGSSTTIIDAVETIIEQCGEDEKFVVFRSNGVEPMVVRNMSDWNNLKKEISEQQSCGVSDYVQEIKLLNELFVELFNENVVINEDIRLNGVNDEEWNITFILSDEMYENSDVEYIPFELEAINNLKTRIKIEYLSYDKTSIKSVEIENKSMFNFK